MGKLDGKVAIVTGGGKGVGKGVALALAKEGAKLVLTGRTLSTLETTCAEFTEMGFDAIPVVCDGGKKDQVQACIAKTIETFGGIDILVNNAQVSTQTPFEQLTEDEMNLALDSGLWATFYFMQETFPSLKERKGSIINFGSNAAMTGMLLQGSYAAAKEAIRGMSRVAANEWGQYGIRVNIVCPFAETPGVKDWAERHPEAYQASLQKVPLRRLGDPEKDIGRVVAFLASEESAYITGETFTVDGGGFLRP